MAKKTRDKDFEAIREKIKEFFANAKEKDLPQTLPALAEFLAWPVEEIVNYPDDGKYAPLINHAKLVCENWVFSQMLRGRIDKATANLILKMHFKYRDDKLEKVKRSISQVLDDIEGE